MLSLYRDVLGFEVTWGDDEGGYADFDSRDVTLALFDRSAMAEAIDAPHDTTAGGDEVAVIFGVDDVDTVFDRLQDDVEVVTGPHDQPGWGIRVAHFRDPDGILLEINEPLENP